MNTLPLIHRPRRWLPAALLAMAALPASVIAQDLAWSGFGTIGYAQSNRDYAYERFVDSGGTVDRDSVFGLQLDGRLNAQWSATLQIKAAPSLSSDSAWEVQPTWAFIGWRPTDEWLVRAGRLRVPLYRHSESLDVGVTYDMARLPTEMYSIAPSTDFDGVSVTRSWSRGDADIGLDVYSGEVKTDARVWTRDGVPGAVEPGARFFGIDIRITGASLSWREPGRVWRIGAHRTGTYRRDGQPLPVSYPYVQIAPGVGYYQVDASQPGPGIQTASVIHNNIYTVAIDEQMPAGWRVSAEYARDVQHDTDLGSDTRGGYVAVFKRVGRATGYVSVGALRSSDSQLDWNKRLNESMVPGYIPGAAQLNASQRLAAESFYATSQRSLALGGSWAFDTQKKLKFEWKRTHIGQVSRLVDTPPGQEDVHDTTIDILSVNYNFAF